MILSSTMTAIIIGIVFSIALAAGILTSRKLAGIPEAAWQQGLKNAFFTGLIFFAVFGSIFLIISVGFNQPIKAALFISFTVIWGMVFFFSLIMWFRNRQKAGRVLLDIRQVPIAASRLQIRETGILAYFDLVKWGKIESYEWDDTDKKVSALKLRFKSRLPTFLRNGVLPIPLEKKEEVKSFLEQYLSELTQIQKRA